MYVHMSGMLALSQDLDKRKFPVGRPKVKAPESLLCTQYIIAFLCNTHESIVDDNDDCSSVHAHKRLPSQGLGHVAGSWNFVLWSAEMKFPSVSILTECKHATHTCVYVHVSQSTLVHEK